MENTPYLTKTFHFVVAGLQPSICGPPPTLSNAYYEITNNTATHHCHRGYTANQTDNVISCLQGQWEEPSLSCLGNSIGTVRCHPFSHCTTVLMKYRCIECLVLSCIFFTNVKDGIVWAT